MHDEYLRIMYGCEKSTPSKSVYPWKANLRKRYTCMKVFLDENNVCIKFMFIKGILARLLKLHEG